MLKTLERKKKKERKKDVYFDSLHIWGLVSIVKIMIFLMYLLNSNMRVKIKVLMLLVLLSLTYTEFSAFKMMSSKMTKNQNDVIDGCNDVIIFAYWFFLFAC